MLTSFFFGGNGRGHPEPDQDRRQDERSRMVDAQIARRGVRDALVTSAMRTVPRHLFVPEPLRDQAYDDGALPLSLGQTISQPYIVAVMTAMLELKGGERVLEVGTGSGYQTAVLGRIAGEVFTLEILPSLSSQAEVLLTRLGYGNVRFRVGDGYRGWPAHAPYDGIIVTAAPDHVPPALMDQLGIGGRLAMPVGGESQELLKIVRGERGFREERGIPVRFVPMTGEAQEGRGDG